MVKKPERVKTGIEKLDGMLSGGLIRDSINLVAGNPGTGKTTMAMQFLLEGIKRGETGIYLSLEEDKDIFYRNMLTHGWDLKKLESEGKFYFEFFRSEELVNHVNNGYQVIDNQIQRMGAKRLVIDSITAYLLICDNELHKRSELKKLFDNIRKWNVTAVFTGESQATDSSYGVDYMVDTIIRLYNRRINQGIERRMRLVEVEKMRGSTHSPHLHPLIIEKKGIVVLADGKPSPS
jgi:circadian clock protein KaiC